MQDYGKTQKFYRERAGLSQNKLALLAGFDHSYVSRLESGARNPIRSYVQRIAEALGLDTVDSDRLLASAGFRPTDLASVLAEPMLAELDDLISILPSDISEDLRGMVRAAVAAGRAGVAQGLSVA